MSRVDKAKRTLLGIDIPRDALAVKIAEQCLGMKSPAGRCATEALEELAQTAPNIVVGFRAAADAAVLYFHERINAARRPH